MIALVNLAVQSNKKVCVVPYKRVCVEVIKLLNNLGYISYFKVDGRIIYVYFNDIKFRLNVLSRPGKEFI
jgi:ribosomal protein S8